MTPPPVEKRPLTQRLGLRLALAVAVALLPLGVISGLQSSSLMEEARARSAAALLGETLLAAAPEARLIRGARVAAEALALTLPAILDDTEQCSAVLRRLQGQSRGVYSYVAFVPPDGMSVCNSLGKPHDLSASARLAKMLTLPEPDSVVITKGAASGQSVLAFGHPVTDDAGGFAGYVSISMPHSVIQAPTSMQAEVRAHEAVEPITLVTFDSEGIVLTASDGLEGVESRLPQDRPLKSLASNVASTFISLAGDGTMRVFAVFPLVEDHIFTLGSWPILVAGDTFSLWISPYLLPALMWLVSVLAAILATEWLVTRHIRTLRRAITSFAHGNHSMDGPDMPGASIEFRELTDAYLRMKYTILRDSAELEDAVHQREVLLREVHHRVKNNLQLISSIINIQMRQSHSRETRGIMKGLQDRVMSLATVHRGLYQTSGLADVRADELLSDIVRQILRMATGPGRTFDVSTNFDDLRLTPDQAVPLSLLLTEALTNAIKYAAPKGSGHPRISIDLSRDGGSDNRAVLRVANTVAEPTADGSPASGSGLGMQLLMAFCQQLGAVSEAGIHDGVYILEVRFAVQSLQSGESRNATPVDGGEETA